VEARTILASLYDEKEDFLRICDMATIVR